MPKYTLNCRIAEKPFVEMMQKKTIKEIAAELEKAARKQNTFGKPGRTIVNWPDEILDETKRGRVILVTAYFTHPEDNHDTIEESLTKTCQDAIQDAEECVRRDNELHKAKRIVQCFLETMKNQGYDLYALCRTKNLDKATEAIMNLPPIHTVAEWVRVHHGPPKQILSVRSTGNPHTNTYSEEKYELVGEDTEFYDGRFCKKCDPPESEK